MIVYMFIHTCIHQNLFTRFLAHQHRNHYYHHYKNGQAVFGVTSSFWDFVFGTLPKHNLAKPDLNEL